ncbi:MAG: ATP-binding protein [Anaerolineaceae bacterium]|nr:ATP-binding protein [Anaerolineaceae bacterium]
MDRPDYLSQLIRKKHNGMIKVITGVRRCGKSYLLFELFDAYLRESGIPDDHIIKLALDDRTNKEYRDPDRLYQYVTGCIKDQDPYYILLDEVQLVPEFEDVLNSFLHIKNADTYVTGSNAKFLSKDIITEFRGRGDQIHLYPLSFAEFMSAFPGEKHDGWQQYIAYGGLPKIMDMADDTDKMNYLRNIFTETYIKDILERNDVRNRSEMEELLDIVASNIGGLTNPKKLSDAFKSVKNVSIHPDTIKNYLGYFEDAFLISTAKRYDVKGKKYISTPMKYYFTDMGLRNARLNFRQIEETHLMENVIYNELCIRGFNVDVGSLEYRYNDAAGKQVQKQLEIDFVCNQGFRRCYIQSALSMPTLEKEEQEQKSLVNVNDAFKKIIIVKDGLTHYNERGILILNLFDFLLNPNSLDY